MIKTLLSRVTLASVASLLLAALAPTAQALPEMARFGYFSCNTCHVSPSGGGILTPYGRSISAERLSTWSKKNEELPLEGLIKKQPDWLLLGGDARYLQLDTETDKLQSGQWLRMQSDLAAAIVLPHVTLVGEGGPRGDAINHEIAGKESWREYYAKVDVTDQAFVRVGRFYPKFGLNMPQHNVNIRRGLLFDEGMENQNAEFTYSSESHEVTLTRMMSVPTNQADGSREQGYAGNYSYYLLNKHRVSVSGLQGVELNGDKRTVLGVNGVFAMGDKWFLLTEEDHQTVRKKDAAPIDGMFFYNRIGYEPIQGVVPIMELQTTVPDVRQRKTRYDSASIGAQWYPRPHFDFESLIGAQLNYTDYTFQTIAYFMAHYYL